MGLTLIIIWLIVATGIYQTTKDFRCRVIEQHDYDIYGGPVKFSYVVAAVCAISAYFTYTATSPARLPANPNGPLWIVMAIFALLIIAGVTAFNFIKTDRESALIATGAQIFVAPSLFIYVVACFILTFFGVYLTHRSKESDPIEEQQKAHEAWMASDLNKDSPNYRFKNDKNGGY